MRVFVLILFFGWILVAADAAGQDTGARLGIYADEAGTEPSLDVTPGIPFHVFVVAHDIPGSIRWWEGRIEGVPPQAFALYEYLYGGWIVDSYNYVYIVSLHACKEPDNAIPLVRLQMLTVEGIAPDTVLRINGSNPSSFGGEPGYVECDRETTHLFERADPPDLAAGERYRLGTLVLNPSPSDRVARNVPSFGSVKARFH